MPNDVIKVEISAYNEMLWKSRMFEMLEQVVLDNARLDYTGKNLSFDDNTLQLFLRAIDAFGYESRVHELAEAEKHKGRAAGSDE